MKIVALLLLAIAMGPVHADAASDGTITLGFHVTLAPRWFDPGDAEPAITPFMVLYALHDALLKPMPGGVSAPGLAESWTASHDGLTYEFVLRKGAKFHNGEQVTAEDVKFTFERYKGGAATILKERVRDVQVVDASRVRFHLKEPWPDFISVYGTTASAAAWIVPKKYVEQVGDDGFKKAPIGAGPYRLVSFKPGVEMVTEAFDQYWRKVPTVKRVVFRGIPDETTRAAALKSGDIDVAFQLSGPVGEEIKRAPNLRVIGPRTSGVFWLDFTDQWDQKSPWHDKRVRQAASLSIDRRALNQAETLGMSRLTGGIVPRGFDFALNIEPSPHDPAKAKQLLAEAGYPKGFESGEFYPYPPYFSMGEALAGYLQAVGIRTRIRTLERAAFLTAYREKKLRGVAVVINGTSGNAATRLAPYLTKNGAYAYGVVPELDDLFQRQARELDRGKREQLLHQIQRMVQERAMFAPLYELAPLAGVGPRVEQAAVGLVAGFPYVAPFEELKLK